MTIVAMRGDYPCVSISNSEIADKLESFASLLDLAEAEPLHVAGLLARRGDDSRDEGADGGPRARGPSARAAGDRAGDRAAAARARRDRPAARAGGARGADRSRARRAGTAARAGAEAHVGDRASARRADGRGLSAGGGAGRPGVPGIGPKTEAKIVAGLRQERPPRPRAVLLNGARALVEAIAESLGGEPAGDPRRWRDASFDFTVVCAAKDPAKILERFERLLLIVAGRARRPARDRRHRRRRPGPGRRRAAGALRHGARARHGVAEYGRPRALARRSRRRGVYRALGIPYCPPELRERPFRGEPPRLVEVADMRRPARAFNWSDGKASVLEMAEAARPRLRVPGDLRPHAKRASRAGP